MPAKENSAVFRPDLGQYVMEYIDDVAASNIGLQIFPLAPKINKAGTFPVIPIEALLDVPDVERRSRSGYPRGDWDYERGEYVTSEKGWEEPNPDDEAAEMDQEAPGVSEKIATKRAMDIILRAQEKRIAAKLYNSSNFTAHDVTNEWDDATNATPITDVKDAKAAFKTQCGMPPDALVLSDKVFENLRVCSTLIAQIKYTFPGIDIANMTHQQMARCLGVPRLIVGGGVYNSADKGQAASITDIWDDEYAALVKISSGADVRAPGVGRTFLWTEDSKSNAVVETYREEKLRADIIRVRHNVDERLIQSFNDSGSVVSNVAAKCVYLMGNITS